MSFLEKFSWEIVFLVLVIFILIYFRKDISAFIGRWKKVGVTAGKFGASIEAVEDATKVTTGHENSPQISPQLIKKINDADFNAKRGLFYTFYYQGNHIWACIFALRCLDYFYTVIPDDLIGARKWLDKSRLEYDGIMRQDPQAREHFKSMFGTEVSIILDRINHDTRKDAQDLSRQCGEFLNRIQK